MKTLIKTFVSHQPTPEAEKSEKSFVPKFDEGS